MRELQWFFDLHCWHTSEILVCWRFLFDSCATDTLIQRVNTIGNMYLYYTYIRTFLMISIVFRRWWIAHHPSIMLLHQNASPQDGGRFPFLKGNGSCPGFSRDHYSHLHIIGCMKQWKCMAILKDFHFFGASLGVVIYWSLFAWPVGGVGAKKKSRFSTSRNELIILLRQEKIIQDWLMTYPFSHNHGSFKISAFER